MNSKQRRSFERAANRALAKAPTTVILEDWTSGSPVTIGEHTLENTVVGYDNDTKKAIVQSTFGISTGVVPTYPMLPS